MAVLGRGVLDEVVVARFRYEWRAMRGENNNTACDKRVIDRDRPRHMKERSSESVSKCECTSPLQRLVPKTTKVQSCLAEMYLAPSCNLPKYILEITIIPTSRRQAVVR